MYSNISIKELRYQMLYYSIMESVKSNKNCNDIVKDIVKSLHFYLDFPLIEFIYLNQGENTILVPYKGTGNKTGDPYNQMDYKGNSIWIPMGINGQINKDTDPIKGRRKQPKSEMVINGFKNGEVFLLLKLKKSDTEGFDRTDESYLLKIMELIERVL